MQPDYGAANPSEFVVQADPRWNRRKQEESQGKPQTLEAPTPIRPRPAPEREGSFVAERPDSPSLSILFEASWVKATAPIGEGAFSRVFEGTYTHPETKEARTVAVKILKKNMLKRRSDCLRFIKEAKIMTRINHRNIVACYGIGKYEDDDDANPGCLFIVQDLVKGGNLLHKVYKQMLNRYKCVYTSQEALQWMIDVAAGMEYLHLVTKDKPMIIHRDLKLENIMLSPEPKGGVTAKLVDFGLHKVIDDRIKKVVKRVMSEAAIGGISAGAGGALGRSRLGGGTGAIDDELEDALAAANSEAPRTRLPTLVQGAQSPLRRDASMRSSAISEEGEGETDEAHLPEISPPTRSLGSSKSFNANSLGAGGEEPKQRSLPKRQSSMQKLMAKMKELKLKVTGKLGDHTVKEQAAEGATPSGSSYTAAAPDKAAGSTSLSPKIKAFHGEAAAADVPPESKKARNEALLNQLIAQQSHARHEQQQVLDDFGIITSGPGQKKRAPVRRAVTWVNEVRYNLTEAVGSWAYMAPEVVLGHPYNEKVDVFSFGVILYEVLHRKLMLLDEIKNDPRKEAREYAEKVARGFRPDIPKHWPDNLRELIASCWAQDPHLRPNFTAVLDVIQELYASGIIARLDTVYWRNGCAFI